MITARGHTLRRVQRARRERGIEGLRELVSAGFGVDEFRAESLRRLRRLVTIDAAFYATVDPATILFTSASSEEPLAAAANRFLDNEYGIDDVNKFTSIAEGPEPVASLDRATRGDRTASARYRDVMAEIGLGDEVRVALCSRGACWGVMCLHREDGELGFENEEIDLFRRVAPILGEGLRRGVAVTAATTGESIAGGPGVIVLDSELAVISTNPQAQHWLAEIDDRDWPRSVHLPVAVLSAAASLRDTRADDARARTRVRRGTGGWLTVHASPLRGDRRETVVVLDAPAPDEITSLALAAAGLTPAQGRVAALVLRGRSTQQIVNELGISANTVQEHLRAAFERFGVGSRRELVAALSGRAP
jgi:DNA-binding CsgD family transcriptional regulator